MDGVGTGSSPVAGFRVVGVGPEGSATGELVPCVSRIMGKHGTSPGYMGQTSAM